jgi:transcriptional regulator with PAS, ATPase and Fis domain
MARPLSPIRAVLRALERSCAPVYVLDAQRRIVFANAALATWVGLPAEQFLGRPCHYHAGGQDALEAACAGLCPPPEAFVGASETALVFRPATEDRPAEQRRARCLPLPSADGGDPWLLVVVDPPASEGAAAAPAVVPSALPVRPEWLHAQLQALRSAEQAHYALARFVGQSPAVLRARELARLAAAATGGVLIVGPPGSGREHLARTIHALRSRGLAALLPLACPLLDAEGMQAGLTALLKAQQPSPGGPATALLLEVDRLPESAQHELSGFLRLPGVELRTLATSRRSLTRLAERGKFLPELAYRLSTLTIPLPPLARRRQDIPLLAQHFVEQHNAAGGKQLSGFQPAAVECLASLPWPRNVDQLRQAVEAAITRATGPFVTVADLPDWVHLARHDQQHPPRPVEPIQLDALLAEIEKEALLRALAQAKGNKSQAAELLGISRGRLLRRLMHFGLIERAPHEPVIFEPLDDAP